MYKKIILIITLILLAGGLLYHKALVRLYQGLKMMHISKNRAEYYVLNNNTQIQDITQKLIRDKNIPHQQKTPLIKGKRRIIIFKYQSGKEKVGGYYSYLIHGNHQTIIFLRGGNGFLGIMRPNNPYSLFKGFNVVGTLYRGNIYGGKDDFGGEDINDVENLIRYFPQIEQYTHTQLEAPFIMMGVSRGGMEMIDALARSDYIKSKVNKAISVSGNLDLRTCMNQRPEMKYLFHKFYKQSTAKNFEEWLQLRDPVNNAKYLSKSLKILLLYGPSDDNVSLDEQRNFKAALEHENMSSKWVTIPQGNHGLLNKLSELEGETIKFIKE